MKLPLPSRYFFHFLLGLATGVSLFPGALPANAQVGLSPLVIESELVQGRARGVLKVINTSNKTLRLRVYSEPFTYEAAEGFTLLESDKDDLSPYLQFSPREVTIPPQSDRHIRIIATIPPRQAQKEHRAVIFTETLAADGEAVNAVGVITRVGSTFYARADELQPELTVQSVDWNAEAKQIQILVENAGPATARPRVEWQLKRGEKTVAMGRNDAVTVVEGKQRLLRLPYGMAPKAMAASSTLAANATAPAPGEYRLIGVLSWQQDKQPQFQSFELPLSIR